MKALRTILTTAVFFLIGCSVSMAQCAMCRATVGSNLSEGRGVIGTGINDGILYLLVITYLSIPTLIFIWYRSARKELRLKLNLNR
jgi:high-affinity nickel permease